MTGLRKNGRISEPSPSIISKGSFISGYTKRSWSIHCRRRMTIVHTITKHKVKKNSAQ